jgi:Uri superfamily endonuclease
MKKDARHPPTRIRRFPVGPPTRLTRSALGRLREARGCYLLLLRIPAITIRVGRLGPVPFAAGLYSYVGSARGRAVTLGYRLRRHLRRAKRRWWHIDYLTTHRQVRILGAYVLTHPRWTEIRLATTCARQFPVTPHFGNSDHAGRTRGHLFLIRPSRSPRRRRAPRGT